ncbi:MAG: PaaX family transcriptional regulator C-terminal domain-containing protein [Acidimicrobiia bacterium]
MQQSRNVSRPIDPEPLLERPLSARSVMASLLLGRQPPEAPVADLVRWCGLFGITEGTARVALHRMSTKGEIRATDGVYRLAGRLAGRQVRQETSLAPRVRDWSGDWRVAVVVATRRDAPTRAGLRDAMRRLHFAERREGVWLRPDNLELEVPVLVRHQCEWLSARPEDDPVALADRLFHPSRWARRAEALATRLAQLTDDLAGREAQLVADAFVAGAAALRHIGGDPLLPAALLPPDWPGSALRAEYSRYQRAFDATARAWFRHAR